MQTNSGNFLIITLIIISILRIGEIFFSEREKIQGRIYFKWNIFFLIGGYILLIGGAILEYFMAGRNINFFITGIVLGMLIIRFFLKRWAVKTLGKYWSAHIEVRETQQLVTAGPYKYLRHPAYLSNIMEVSATPLILNAYFSFLMAFFVYLFFIYFRIQSEEKILIQ
ncbi:MAG TPA: hypothetical protein DHV62_02295, partial [Elusimicrobia bacterium]|nr:hypothetical protein [Elusimicrobiota bacterium]